MQAPIPDPFAAPNQTAPLVKGPRPASLIWVIGISWLFNIASTLSEGSITAPGFTVFIYALGLFIDYSLWSGRNWARIVSIILGALGTFSVFTAQWDKPVSVIIQGASSVFYVAYVVYLTRPSVRAFFTGRGA